MNYTQITQDAVNGIESPFKALNELKKLQAEIGLCITEVTAIALSEASKYEKAFKVDGLKIEQRAGRKIWNFKKLDEWQTYNKAKADCEERYKLAYSNYEKGIRSVTEEGEILPLPEVTYTKDVLVIKEI